MDSEIQSKRQKQKSTTSDMLKKIIFQFIADDIDENYASTGVNNSGIISGVENSPPNGKRKRNQYERGDSWSTAWGRMLKHRDVSNPSKRTGKLFRRRFRVPYQVFEKLLELAVSRNLFGHGKADCSGRVSIPIELKLLGVLRILGRGCCFDDVAEALNISEDTARRSFFTFCRNFVHSEYDNIVKPPEGEKLNAVMKVYESMGLPGCSGLQRCSKLKHFPGKIEFRKALIATPKFIFSLGFTSKKTFRCYDILDFNFRKHLRFCAHAKNMHFSFQKFE